MLMWLNISLHRDKLLPIEGLLWMCLARDDIKFQFIIKNSEFNYFINNNQVLL